MSSARKSLSRSRSASASVEECLSSTFAHPTDTVKWVVRVVLLIYASFVASNLPSNMTWLFDNTVARLVVVLLILGLATCDPASAILLTVGFVLSIQAANKQYISKLANVATTANTAETFMAEVVASSQGDASHRPMAASLHAAQNAASGVSHAAGDAAHTLGNAAHSAMTAVGPRQPAASDNASHLFTTPNQMAGIQTNTVQDNQFTEVRTWQQELGPQGLSQPSGFNFNNGSPAGGFASSNPSCAPTTHQ